MDTIFLLSDGCPTHFGPKQLRGWESYGEAWRQVRALNELRRCVIHTIGVGQSHNRHLMEQIARDTGGTYVAVGMD